MIVKFNLGNNEFKVFDNVTDMFFKSRMLLPDKVYELTETKYRGEDRNRKVFSLDNDTVDSDDGKYVVTSEEQKYDYSHLGHMIAFIRTFDTESFPDNAASVEKHSYINVFPRPNQLRWAYVRFISNGIIYKVCTSMDVYICNDSGKTIETIRH